MKYTIQLIRSVLFNIAMYIAMPIVGLLYLPWAIASPKGAIAGCHRYCIVVIWLLRWMVGMRCEVRGTPPTEQALVAAKHQSFLDVLMIYHAVPRGKFIFKDLLKYAPVIGQFGLRIGCIPVKRGKRGAAIKKMLADVKNGSALPGQLIIYSQGTRIAPGVKAPYKIGTGALYKEMDQPCYPVATNVGVLWPKRGFYRAPGVAVVDFLPSIAPGMPVNDFMTKLEIDVEAHSDALAAEAGFHG
ncbi:MAG: lysophospholipid acyltransferase family protein [Yoonia sp.]|nr:lysophospholipid acyltransferase family protein [Yoonia sp.]